jgi:methylenetetrahydrofolate dehydrogenase (NADP+)/methenyltetrahydrofolate cyclohydrolase
VGIPLAIVLARDPYNATVTICHEHTIDLERQCKISDIVVTAVGRSSFELPASYIRHNAAVIDVGIRRVEGKIVGDFKPDVKHPCSYTPVPGGVGPTTISMLISNTLAAFNNQQN